MTENTAPETTPDDGFDLEAWLFDAELPQQSATVFKAGRLPAEAGALKEAIVIERGLINSDSTAVDKIKLTKLEARYATVLQKWLDSKITVYVTAITPDKLRELRTDHTKTTEGMDTAVANEVFGFDLLAAAIIGIAEPGKEYENPAQPYDTVSWTRSQVRGLARRIGATQMDLILAARQTAQNGLPEVDADFLLESSGENEPATQD